MQWISSLVYYYDNSTFNECLFTCNYFFNGSALSSTLISFFSDIFLSFYSNCDMAFIDTEMAALESDYSHGYDVSSEAV
jgi:hypothetical protein